MLFSFSSSSIHLFPTCPWLSSCAVADLTNLLYPLPHHCPHMFLSSILIMHSIVVSDVVGNDHPHLFLFFAQLVLPTLFSSVADSRCSGCSHFICASRCHHHSLHRPSLNPGWTRLPSSPSVCFAEHLWHPPESLGQSRIHAEHVTSSPDSRQLWGVCLLTT